MEHSPLAIESAKGSTWDLDKDAERLGWKGIGIAFTTHRDSDLINKSNWEVIHEDLVEHFSGPDDPPGDISIAHFTHWTVGWMDHLIYNTARDDIQHVVDQFHESLRQYPVLDEIRYSQMEWDKNHSEFMFCGSDDEDCPCDRKLNSVTE